MHRSQSVKDLIVVLLSCYIHTTQGHQMVSFLLGAFDNEIFVVSVEELVKS